MGPARTRLTITFGHDDGYPWVYTHDNRNVDGDCVLTSSGQTVGCNGGAFEDYVFSEARSLSGCNGIIGDAGVSECLDLGGGSFWNTRTFTSSEQAYTDGAGPGLKTDWHLVEVYFEMNSIVDGIAVADGLMRYWRDGEAMLSFDEVMWRTGQFPNLSIDQVFFEPHADSDGTIWYDDLTFARGR